MPQPGDPHRGDGRKSPLSGPRLPHTWDGQRIPLTPRQLSLLPDVLARPGAERWVEQVYWCFTGPLDPDRLTAAWQSVVDREQVLRSALVLHPQPHIVRHALATAGFTHHPAGGIGWEALLRRDRLRGFDLGRPGPLRVTVAGGGPQGVDGRATTRVLFTYHHLMLDNWSAVLLEQELCRAYLAGGSLPGQTRRPDMYDYTRWLHNQDTLPAREFFTGAVPAGQAVSLPTVAGSATGQQGFGRIQVRLDRHDARKLRDWTASLSITESSAVQAVWTMLLYRAAGGAGSAQVGFGMAVSGRAINLDIAERLPGPLMNILPVAVRISASTPVDTLARQLRDQALDMTGYEWVALGQIGRWSGRRSDEQIVDSVVAFTHYPQTPPDQETDLAALGITVSPPYSIAVQPSFPLALLAGPADDGSLLLRALHDRARVADIDASRIVGQCVRLLRELPASPAGTTVRELLRLLAGSALPRAAAPRTGQQ